MNTKLNLLPKDKLDNTSSAAIRITKDNRFIYISSRGADLLTVISLEIIQQINSGGMHPRDFILSEDEQYLLVVNKDTDDMSSFQLDKTNGKIVKLINTDKVPHAIGIIL